MTGNVALAIQQVSLKDGKPFQPRVVTFAHSSGDRSVEVTPINMPVGRIVSMNATIAGSVSRGQAYLEVMFRRKNLIMGRLGRGYMHEGESWNMGEDAMMGPGGGNGHIRNRVIADNIAPADITHVLGISNQLRKINGFIWYYHASNDVAARALRATVRNLGDGLPTGMTKGINTSIQNYPSAGTLALAADQEGMIYVNATSGKSYAVSVDNGTPVVEDITTAPDPFPYWAQELDVGEIFFNVANEEAADRQSIYIIEEDWIQI